MSSAKIEGGTILHPSSGGPLTDNFKSHAMRLEGYSKLGIFAGKQVLHLSSDSIFIQLSIVDSHVSYMLNSSGIRGQDGNIEGLGAPKNKYINANDFYMI